MRDNRLLNIIKGKLDDYDILVETFDKGSRPYRHDNLEDYSIDIFETSLGTLTLNVTKEFQEYRLWLCSPGGYTASGCMPDESMDIIKIKIPPLSLCSEENGVRVVVDVMDFLVHLIGRYEGTKRS